MEKFNLKTWLANPSRKVMTRRGNPVRIICTDRKHGEDELPVVFLEECSNGGEFLLSCKSDGTSDEHYATQYDLFFADEEEELTEFEKRFIDLIRLWMSGNTNPDENLTQSRFDAKELLDLARNELEKSNPYSGNQKQEWSEEDEKNWRHCLHYIDAYVTPVKEHVNWFKNIRNRIHSQQQPKQEWSEEDEKLYTSALWHIKNSCGNGGKDSGEYEVYNWIKSIKARVQPQPKQEWSDEDYNEIETVAIYLENMDNEGMANVIRKIRDKYSSFKPQPKQEWSEEDENMFNDIMNYLCSNDSCELEVFGEWYDWLKSLKDRVQPQQKQEWSKEDEKMLESTLLFIDEHRDKHPLARKCYDWLKSIKPNHLKPSEVKNKTKNKCPNYSEGYGCSTSPLKHCDTCPDYRKYNHWKPSEKEIRALSSLLNFDYSMEHGETYRTIDNLYNELKILCDYD